MSTMRYPLTPLSALETNRYKALLSISNSKINTQDPENPNPNNPKPYTFIS